jgi:cell division protein FtsB
MRTVSLAAIFRVIAVGVLMLNLYAALFARRGLRDFSRIKNENKALTERLSDVKREKENLDKKVAAMSSDVREQERSVRQTLGYVRPGEVVIEFP